MVRDTWRGTALGRGYQKVRLQPTTHEWFWKASVQADRGVRGRGCGLRAEPGSTTPPHRLRHGSAQRPPGAVGHRNGSCPAPAGNRAGRGHVRRWLVRSRHQRSRGVRRTGLPRRLGPSARNRSTVRGPRLPQRVRGVGTVTDLDTGQPAAPRGHRAVWRRVVQLQQHSSRHLLMAWWCGAVAPPRGLDSPLGWAAKGFSPGCRLPPPGLKPGLGERALKDATRKSD